MFDFDEHFIQKLREKDQNAFNTFYLKTVDIFFRYIRGNFNITKEDAEDIIADFYVKRRDVAKTYKSGHSFSAYVRTIFKNIIKDHFKKMSDTPFSNLRTNDDFDDFEDQLEDDINLTDFFDNDFKFEQIEKAMSGLDESSRDIVYRRFIEERSTEEISKMLNITNENVRQKISRAIKHLKDLLG